MKLTGRIAVVTGGASGIGRALCRRFKTEGARGVFVADIDKEGAAAVAAEIGGIAVHTDVSKEAEILDLVRRAVETCGRIDLFCSNAGIGIEGGVETSDAEWQRIFGINFMAHVYAARAVVPAMVQRGEGYLLQTVSAAGLLNQIGSAPYAVTKHAALGLAEWLSITYGDRGLRVSALCPQGVRTKMLEDATFGGGVGFLAATAIEPERVADAVIEGLDRETFLILPHPEVAEYVRRKATDYDRWLRGMRRLQASGTGHRLL
ncbi:MAG: SDR family oxidoreductase [Bryobacteraceae bacterium]|jgi:NAD(P)-dependent dehydrogenase (short-subunit alcohol dehydrogenase family)